MSLWDDFVELSQTVFAPLEESFGFQRRPPTRPFVHYDSSSLQISFFYDCSRDHELDVAFRRKADVGTQKPSYGLSSLMAIHDPAAWETYVSSFPNDKHALKSSLLAMKDLLFRYGASLIAGDESDLGKCDELEKQVAAEFGRSDSSGDYKSRVRQVILRFHKNAESGRRGD